MKNKQPLMPLYTVRRCKKGDTRYGPTHGSEDAIITLCGYVLDENWWIETNESDGMVTCKKCLKAIKEGN